MDLVAELTALTARVVEAREQVKDCLELTSWVADEEDQGE